MDALRGSLVDHHLSEIRKQIGISRSPPTADEKLQKLVDRCDWADFIAQSKVRFDSLRQVDPNARGLQTEPTAELCREVARDEYDPYHPVIPWLVLAKRDVSVASSGGGYLVDQNVNAAVEEILRPWSITVAGGVQILSGLRGNTSIPQESAAATAYWLPDETTAITESQQTIAQIPTNPRLAGALVDVSRLLQLQGAGVDSFLRASLLRTAGTLVDVAVLAGSGGVQPLGIINTAGIGATTGGSFALSHVLAARAAVAAADANDENVSWIGTPAVRQLLAARQRFSGVDSALWQNDEIDARPAYVSTTVPSATLICGDFSKVTLPFGAAV